MRGTGRLTESHSTTVDHSILHVAEYATLHTQSRAANVHYRNEHVREYSALSSACIYPSMDSSPILQYTAP